MKLLDEKKFLEDIREGLAQPNTKMISLSSYDIEELLSKHLKDLPKKKDEVAYVKGGMPYKLPTEKAWSIGYNNCLKDCEDK